MKGIGLGRCLPWVRVRVNIIACLGRLYKRSNPHDRHCRLLRAEWRLSLSRSGPRAQQRNGDDIGAMVRLHLAKSLTASAVTLRILPWTRSGPKASFAVSNTHSHDYSNYLSVRLCPTSLPPSFTTTSFANIYLLSRLAGSERCFKCVSEKLSAHYSINHNLVLLKGSPETLNHRAVPLSVARESFLF